MTCTAPPKRITLLMSRPPALTAGISCNKPLTQDCFGFELPTETSITAIYYVAAKKQGLFFFFFFCLSFPLIYLCSSLVVSLLCCLTRSNRLPTITPNPLLFFFFSFFFFFSLPHLSPTWLLLQSLSHWVCD